MGVPFTCCTCDKKKDLCSSVDSFKWGLVCTQCYDRLVLNDLEAAKEIVAEKERLSLIPKHSE